MLYFICSGPQVTLSYNKRFYIKSFILLRKFFVLSVLHIVKSKLDLKITVTEYVRYLFNRKKSIFKDFICFKVMKIKVALLSETYFMSKMLLFLKTVPNDSDFNTKILKKGVGRGCCTVCINKGFWKIRLFSKKQTYIYIYIYIYRFNPQ